MKRKIVACTIFIALIICLGLVMLFPKFGKEERMLKGNSSERTVDAFPITSSLLRGTTWKREASWGNELVEFTDSYYVFCTINRSYLHGERSTTKTLYYLSDFIPTRFDSSKVGNETEGKFLIIPYFNSVESQEIVWLDLSELHLKGPDDNVFVYKRK